jgi:hypothetical protein
MRKNTTTTATSALITRASLATHYDASRKVEAAIWIGLRKLAISETSHTSAVSEALSTLGCPDWCEAEAWLYMLRSFASWAHAHGSLEVMHQVTTLPRPQVHPWLKRRRGERVVEEIEVSDDDLD